MKSFSTLLFVLVATATTLSAQLPSNGDFEQWTNEYNPVNWGTDNSPPALLTTYQSLDAHSGKYAAGIYTQLYNGNIQGGTVRSYSVPFSTALHSLNGWYKLKTTGRDRIRVRVTLHGRNNVLLDTRAFELTTTTEVWTSFSFPLDVEPDDGSGTGPLMVATSFEIIPDGTLEQVGAVAILDDIAFETAPAGVEKGATVSTADALAVIQNGRTLRVHTAGNRTRRLSLSLYDMLGVQAMHHAEVAFGGREIAIPIDTLPSGCYLVVVRYGASVHRTKVIVP